MTIGYLSPGRVVTRAMTAVELDSSALKDFVAFTGRLACMTRDEAFEIVRQHGGMPSRWITKRTKLLIVGELGWPLLDDGRPSNKLSRATAYGIPVASERRFLEWIGKALPDSVHKTYPIDQLAALSDLSGERSKNSCSSVCWTNAVAGLAFVTGRAPVRSPSYLRAEFHSPKSFVASARSGNGCLMLD